MNVKVGDKNYIVNFSYSLDDQERRVTQCVVFMADRPTDTNPEGNEALVSVGVAVCAKEDNFSKVVGRKIALAHALTTLDKSTRTAIWDVYRKTSRIV